MKLFAHYLNDHAFRALSIEFGVKDLLPWAEVQLALGDRQDDLAVDDDVLQVGVAVGLAGLVVAVVAVLGGEALEEFVQFQQTADETRRFLADTRPDKRSRAIDARLT